MGNSNYISLDKKIQKLKSLTEKLDIYSISNRLFHELIMFAHMGERVKLNSPARQSLYLLGIMSSQKICNAEEYTDEKADRVFTLLNDIFSKYLNAYFPNKKDIKQGIDNTWLKSRHASMPTFLGYFFESKKIATDELKKDILKTYERFEKEISNNFGLSHTDMVDITDRIGVLIQSKVDRIYHILDEVNKKRLEFSNSSVENYHEALKAIQETCGPLMLEFKKLSEETCIFRFDEIDDIDSEKLNLFIRHFVSTKGHTNEIKYITDENPLEYSPIITVDNNHYTLSSINFILLAIQKKIEKFFKNSKYADSFRKARDKKLEQDTRDTFNELLPVNAILLESVFENNKSSNEHDIVIIVGRAVLVIEAKAAPRREPLREPSKAFTRIRDDFKKKTGIQSGCDQAFSLKNLIEKNDITILYDKKGNVLHTLSKQEIDEVYCICVTKDDFGFLATDLSVLLEKPVDFEYPWVINIDDLRYFFSCLKYIGKEWEFFMDYLRQRIRLMGKIISGDELEIAGAYLKYDGFKTIKENSPPLFLDISESNVFDEIHMAKIDGNPYILKTIEPDFIELDKQKILGRKSRNTKIKNKKNTEQKKSRRKNRK